MTDNPFAESAERAGRKTDEKFQFEMKDLALSKEALGRLFPTEVDKKVLSQLVEMTQKASNELELFEKIKSSSADLGKSAAKLLKSFLI